jgi:hypothetical protein
LHLSPDGGVRLRFLDDPRLPGECRACADGSRREQGAVRRSGQSIPLFDRARAGQAAAPGSLAAADALVAHARRVVAATATALSVATDHLVAWRTIAPSGSPLTIYAPITLVRAALEGAFVARWLVDPTSESVQRVARAMAWQIEDYRQRASFEAAAIARAEARGHPVRKLDPPAHTGEQRRAELVAARAAAGIPEVRLPKMTELARLYGLAGKVDAHWAYRLASAYAHGLPWSLMSTTLSDARPAATAGLNRGRVTASDTLLWVRPRPPARSS